MTLQILPCDIPVSGELGLKSTKEKREVRSSDTWAKRCSPLARKQTKWSWARPAQSSSVQPTKPNLCCCLPAIKLYIVILFHSPSSWDLLWVNDFPARPRESHRLWGIMACVKSSSFLLWEVPLQTNWWPERGKTSALSPQAGYGQVTSPSPLHQPRDALLVQRGLEPHVFLPTLMASSPQHGLTDRCYKAQPVSDTNWMVYLVLSSFYRFYLFFPWANKYTETTEDWPDSSRVRLFNDFWFPWLVGGIAVFCIRREPWHS